MKTIKRKISIFTALTCLNILLVIMLFVFSKGVPETFTLVSLVSIIIVTAIVMGFWLREFSRLRTARLIVENAILHIHTAVISQVSNKARQSEDIENIEVIVSYFGVLLDDKIIKFNQGGIKIIASEIGGDFISFTYGTERTL